MIRRAAVLLLLAAVLPVAGGLQAQPAPPAATARRTLVPDDIFNLRTVRDPRVSPDGAWVAYTVSRLDREADRGDTDVYMIPAAGGAAIRLTTSPKAESRPRWSPDGRYLAFLSSREGEHTQVWLLDRRGGEAVRLTSYDASVSDLAWSPDSTRLALVVGDPDPDRAAGAAGEKPAGEPRPRPIVIRRLQFKRDGEGYLTDRRDHIYVFEVASRTSTQVTTGPYDDRSPAWSPDGALLAFVSNRTEEPDSNDNTDIFVVEPRPGAAPRRLTTSPGEDSSPVFTPDGRHVVYLAGGDPADIWYATNAVAVVPVSGGAPRVLTPDLDRNVQAPRVDPDGRHVLFLVEDAGNVHLARVSLGGGAVERVIAGDREIEAFDVGPRGEIVVLESQPDYPAELFAARGSALERLTHENDAWLSGVALGRVERFRARSRDGTLIDGFLTRPPVSPPGRLPAILRIHGGPVSQYAWSFELEWQMLAAAGYAVIAANPRGSSGRGRAFSRAIFADWGNKDFEDVMAAVDHVIDLGVADPDRLGVGGWSYGGILTNYVITKSTRFKAAVSGASEVNYLANYGTDHYQREWEAELGLPWRNTELWIRLSPFFRVEQIVTPTLVMCGEEDWNVPLLNSEQLYQALRRLGRTTELVVYPGESHGLRRPSFIKDRYERYLAWYGRFLNPGPPTAPGG
jgi:dipeptidyl aminopeptidase/acylaminoacyl peptidase